MSTRSHIITAVDAFLAVSEMSERAFGMAAVQDSMFVARLRDPRVGVTLTTIARAEAFMATGHIAPSRAARRAANDEGEMPQPPAGSAQSIPQEQAA